MSKTGINVVSFFDGMSCGQLALEKAGVKVKNYLAAEIDKHAIIVTQSNYPDTKQIGDVTKVRFSNGSVITEKKAAFIGNVDLVIGGSPCQGFSFAGKQLNFEDPRSKLFFEFVRFYKECKEYNPNVKFLLENVNMKQEFKDIISEYLGVEPIYINSNLVSAQNRKRYYWTNIQGVEVPEDRGVMLTDIIHELSEPIDTVLGGKHAEWLAKNGDYRFKKRYSSLATDKAICMTARQYANWNGTFWFEELNEYVVPYNKTLQILDKEVERGKVGFFNKDSQANRVYYVHDKGITLCGDAGGGAAKMGQYLLGRITPDRVNKRQNGQRFNDGKKFYTLTAKDRHGILIEGYIRKLTPVECERLQTVPDGYTDHVSKTQRYKMLGNGWTVDVIVEFFKNL